MLTPRRVIWPPLSIDLEFWTFVCFPPEDAEALNHPFVTGGT
jgi:hypothetical protein